MCLLPSETPPVAVCSTCLAAGIWLPARFRISRPAVSRHLTVLRKAGLVSVRRRGREQIYRLRAQPLHEVFDWVEHYRAFWYEKMAALGDHLVSKQRES
jgi:DNA-binding transcriptional ArsR family regulator